MICFLIIMCSLLPLLIMAGIFFAIFGGAFMFIFIDIMVCVLLIVGIVTIIKKLTGKDN